jgi:hypothetical protein
MKGLTDTLSYYSIYRKIGEPYAVVHKDTIMYWQIYVSVVLLIIWIAIAFYMWYTFYKIWKGK